MQGRPTKQPKGAGRAAPAGSRALAAADVPPLRPGSTLGRYELVVRLSRSATTEIWLTRGNSEKGAALKALRVDVPQTAEVVSAFVREATIAAKLHHPHIVELTDCGRVGERHYMAMEHVDGMSLAQVRQRLAGRGGRLPLGLLAGLLQQICGALHYAHELGDDKGWLGFLHRDICPENILVSASGIAKLIDFGAARMRSVPDAVAPPSVRNRYAAPERVQGLSEDRRSDLYSIGVILYELATGALPFQGTDLEVISQIVEAKARDPREVVPELPEELARIIVRAMASKFADRYPNCEALAADLEAFGRSDAVPDVEQLLRELFDGPAEPERVPTPVPPDQTIRVAAAEPSAEETTKVAPPEPAPAPASGERFAPDADFSNDDITRPTTMVIVDDIVDVTPELVVEAQIAPLAPAWLNERRQAISQAPAGVFGASRRDGGSGSFSFDPAPKREGPGPEVRDAFPAPRTPPATAAAPDVFSLYARGATPPGERPVVAPPPPPPPPPAAARGRGNPAVQRFDRGLEFLGAKLYELALVEWEEACRLDPENRIYQTNLKRLRAQIAARVSQRTERE